MGDPDTPQKGESYKRLPVEILTKDCRTILKAIVTVLILQSILWNDRRLAGSILMEK